MLLLAEKMWGAAADFSRILDGAKIYNYDSAISFFPAH